MNVLDLQYMESQSGLTILGKEKHSRDLDKIIGSYNSFKEENKHD